MLLGNKEQTWSNLLTHGLGIMAIRSSKMKRTRILSSSEMSASLQTLTRTLQKRSKCRTLDSHELNHNSLSFLLRLPPLTVTHKNTIIKDQGWVYIPLCLHFIYCILSFSRSQDLKKKEVVGIIVPRNKVPFYICSATFLEQNRT